MFVRFVDDCLTRFHGRMPRFRLSTNIDFAPLHVNRWLGVALDYHAQELRARILDYTDKLPYSIPRRVLSAEFIESLTLAGGIKIDGISSAHLPSLRSLHLSRSHIDNRMFQRLLTGCPLLEDLSVICLSPLSVIEVSNLDYLKRVAVVVSIRAPALAKFHISGIVHLKRDYSSLVVN
ncbi:hypothetical protein CRG98_022973, partial [Punica granatum]